MALRNPALTVNEFAKFLRELGDSDFADMVQEMPHVVQPFMGKITAKLLAKNLIGGGADARERGRVKARFAAVRVGARETGRMLARRDGRSDANRPLTDYEGWTMLAGLVDTALGDQPVALREALKIAFLEEASKAA